MNIQYFILEFSSRILLNQFCLLHAFMCVCTSSNFNSEEADPQFCELKMLC